jgi:opacity protein-like surface antigen
MKLLRLVLVVAGMVAATTAFAGEHSEGLLGIQITNGTADLYSPGAPGYISAYDHSEVGIGIQYWRLMSKDYAFTFSAGIGTFSETDKPGTAAPINSTDFKYTQSSWNVRVGGDRAAKVGERAIIYFGPGLEMWSGKAKFDGGPAFTTAYETQNVTRFGISGRVGGVMLISEKVGINCQIGRYLGIASAEEDGAKASWWPSGFQAAGGLIFRI